MHRHLERNELITRLVSELRDSHADGCDPQQLETFARAVLRRVDDEYLYNHRLTTLGAQLRDSFEWVVGAMDTREVAVRCFRPALDAHGYELEGCVIETVMPDQPFIFDTLKLYMQHAGVRVLNSLHIILPVVFTPEGELRTINGDAEDAENFSYTRWFTASAEDEDQAAISREVARRLDLSRAMVKDFARMKHDVMAVANELEFLATLPGASEEHCEEVADFLRWLVDANFVFMGVSAYTRGEDGHLGVVPERGLGSMRGVAAPSGEAGAAEIIAFLSEHTALAPPLARVRKSAHESVLHRAGRVDEIAVRTFDHSGDPAGGVTLHGMFTHKGLGEPGGSIPILRRKLDRVLQSEGTVRSSYEHKTLVHAFNALPVEFLFEADATLIGQLIRMTAHADDERLIKAHIAAQRDARSAFAFIVLPRELYSDELRAIMQSALQAELGANYADHRVHLGKYGSVALHFYLTGDSPFDRQDIAVIERRLVEIATPWQLRLQRALESELGDGEASTLYRRYAHAFPESYTDSTDVGDALVDIQHLERVAERGHTRFDIFPSTTSPGDALLRIYHSQTLLLTDILPVVDNFGVVVAEQYAYDVRPENVDGVITVNTLRVRRGEPDLLEHREALIEGLDAVFSRQMRSDRINRLLVRARIAWREVDALRAYLNYSRQLGSQLTAEITQKVLMAHATYVGQLAELFRARFDPDNRMSVTRRRDRVARLERRLRGYLDTVNGFEEDRILRLFLDLVQATERTNFYRRRADDSHYLSFKIACDRVPDMPDPRPVYEIYVHHVQVEGVHLRGGKVARGGLRWSDRLDDYRSEVLDLMATQVLKNTLIVPTGAKGGFVLKSPPDDWQEARTQADELYKVFIRGLLDVTDNIVDGEPAPPDRVITYDAADPYLVVAADKGTAHLSDTANALSAAYGFWLGDAFASGGSVGYDHKKMGITARGAWVCVRRHFLEMGVDPERDEITVAGIGDMSGDVFGNGLLMSKTVKLIAAFNHRHIFVDPDPDPARSFAERERLFALGRSSWSDYDLEALSPGGGIFDRGAKSVLLSPHAAERLRAPAREMSGEVLIQLIMRADVDLLWNGGIGTYVKSAEESHADVGDEANDRVRVDAHELSCRVIGEGGNLGMTMRSRVAFASAGGRVNLDAIDNSGGVDLSDHEVNLKTLLEPEVAAGRMTRDDRDELLVSVGETVCDTVLANNDSQCLAISLDEARSRHDIWSAVHAMMFLREQLGFSRRTQRLPRGVEQIRQREALGMGLLRPELAKLLSYSKMHARAGLEAIPIAERAAARPFVTGYFPPSVVEARGEAIDRHLLYDEIAATAIVNRVVDAAGLTMFPTLTVATEREVSDIAAAYLIAERVLNLGQLREALRGSADVPVDRLYDALVALEDALTRATRALLWTHPTALRLGADEPAIHRIEDATTALAGGALSDALPDRVQRAIKDAALDLGAHDVPTALATRVAQLAWIDHAFHVAEVMRATDGDAERCASAYFEAGFGTRILDFAEAIARQSYPDRWDNVAQHSIVRTLLDSVVRVATFAVGAGQRADEAFLATHELDDVAAHILELMRERIPVSAMLVTSERLKRRVDQLSTPASD